MSNWSILSISTPISQRMHWSILSLPQIIGASLSLLNHCIPQTQTDLCIHCYRFSTIDYVLRFALGGCATRRVDFHFRLICDPLQTPARLIFISIINLLLERRSLSNGFFSTKQTKNLKTFSRAVHLV